MGAEMPLRRVKRIQRNALALLLLSGVINYMDRATLSIGLPLIRRDLGFSIAESGLLLSAFLWSYLTDIGQAFTTAFALEQFSRRPSTLGALVQAWRSGLAQFRKP